MQIYKKTLLFPGPLSHLQFVGTRTSCSCSRNCSGLVCLTSCFPSMETDNPCPKEQPRLNLFSALSGLQLALLLQCQRGRCIIWEAFQMHPEQSKAL